MVGMGACGLQQNFSSRAVHRHRHRVPVHMFPQSASCLVLDACLDLDPVCTCLVLLAGCRALYGPEMPWRCGSSPCWLLADLEGWHGGAT